MPSKSHRLTRDERPQARSQSDNGQALVGASVLRAVYMTQAWQPETLGASPPFACVPLPFHPPCKLAHSAAPASVPPLSSRLSFKSTHISGAAGCTPVPVFPPSRGHCQKPSISRAGWQRGVAMGLFWLMRDNQGVKGDW